MTSMVKTQHTGANPNSKASLLEQHQTIEEKFAT